MNIGFIGIGNMGGAILKAYAAANTEDTLYAYRRSTDILEKICEETGANPCENIASLVAACDIVLLGVKPQNFTDIMPEVLAGAAAKVICGTDAPAMASCGTDAPAAATCDTDAPAAAAFDTDAPAAASCGTDAPAAATCGPTYVSMAAGLSLDTLEEMLGEGAKIVRLMPNTPAMIGRGMTGICRNENVSEEAFAKVVEICNSLGDCEEVPESLFHAVIGASGSSPAYTYMYIQALIEAAVAEGMDEAQAKHFAAKAVEGAAAMVLASADSPETLRDNVCSKGGTTIEAVKRLQQDGFDKVIKDAFAACVKRSKEMSGE